VRIDLRLWLREGTIETKTFPSSKGGPCFGERAREVNGRRGETGWQSAGDGFPKNAHRGKKGRQTGLINTHTRVSGCCAALFNFVC
jgi:hypothetical protein